MNKNHPFIKSMSNDFTNQYYQILQSFNNFIKQILFYVEKKYENMQPQDNIEIQSNANELYYLSNLKQQFHQSLPYKWEKRGLYRVFENERKA